MTKAGPKVFISSTLEDLKEYRDTVRDAVLRAGAVPVMLEDYPLSGQTIEESMKKQLAESDAVVFLIGHRSGALDPKTGKSWVEREYEAAQRLQKPSLAFLAAEDVPWPPKFIDPDRSIIDRFRRELASKQVVSFFSGTSDLRLELAQALARWVVAIEKGSKAEHRPAASTKREVRIIRLLLSSPGDVAEERDRVAQAVFRFNQDAVEETGLFIKLVRWEDMAPQIGPKAQAVINKQIGPYHMFCGIMWNRFGTPTEIAASGTKEEFDGAVTCWEKNGRPWITFYFCDRPANFVTPEQLQQKGRVLEFRSEVQDKGLVRVFLTAQEFEDKVYEDLKRIVRTPEFLRILDGD